MPSWPRRAALVLPILAAPGLARSAAGRIPPFPEWLGRTALLRGEGGAARLRLDGEGGGVMAVRMLLFCRVLPVLDWRIGADGASLAYRRVAALDRDRVVGGEARILAEAGGILWVEASSWRADFEGFAPAGAAASCG